MAAGHPPVVERVDGSDRDEPLSVADGARFEGFVGDGLDVARGVDVGAVAAGRLPGRGRDGVEADQTVVGVRERGSSGRGRSHFGAVVVGGDSM